VAVVREVWRLGAQVRSVARRRRFVGLPLLLTVLLLTGCVAARYIGRVGLNILQPVKVGSGGTEPFDVPVPPALTPAQLAADNAALANLDPTACDPSDADGDPFDDDCGPAAPTPTQPQR
jgi:hypothetical protein